MKTHTHRYPQVLHFSLGLLLVLASCAAPSRAPDPEPPPSGAVVSFSVTSSDPAENFEDGVVLDPAEHDALSLTAHTEPEEVGSVRFRLGALEHTANAAPYTFSARTGRSSRETTR